MISSSSCFRLARLLIIRLISLKALSPIKEVCDPILNSKLYFFAYLEIDFEVDLKLFWPLLSIWLKMSHFLKHFGSFLALFDQFQFSNRF